MTCCLRVSEFLVAAFYFAVVFVIERFISKRSREVRRALKDVVAACFAISVMACMPRSRANHAYSPTGEIHVVVRPGTRVIDRP